MSSISAERHFRVKELAVLWSLSPASIIKLFTNEPGVMKLHSSASGRRPYVTLSIPESVATRVHKRLANDTLQPSLPGRNPLRVIRLRDLNGGVSKQPRHVFKRDPASEHPNR